ncbi:response regulator [Paenibacillus sp. P96]|uniref:Response regulator n=1 Tax=Paenibacillus zeirhizosphaerae TaxID=2987519 RepID=A0ABT9FWI7_9BACL|nr:response regulator [Paenibacillus sp. P96]MDP4099088.1 response regulator [Paenibacillus sp. P96]
MYKALIVDDEEPLREAIRILGDWKGLGITEVYEAENGETGLDMLKRHNIDLVMVDMKMPGLNGVDLLQIMEQDYPQLLTIVISGYNDFEFTRQAIRSKVIDYLLKPVNRTDLNQALRKAIDVLDAKRKSESDIITQNITLNMSLPKLKEKMYLSIVDRSFRRQAHEAFLPLIGADYPGNRFLLSVLRLMNVDEVRHARFGDDPELLDFAVTNVLAESGEERLQCFSFVNPRREREVIAVFTMTDGRAEDLAFQAGHRVRKAVASLHQLFGLKAVAGIGGPQQEVTSLSSSYASVKAWFASLDVLKLRGEPLVQTAEQAVAANTCPVTGQLTMIQKAFETGGLAHAKNLLSDFIHMIRARQKFSLGDADRTLQELDMILREAGVRQGMNAVTVAPEEARRSAADIISMDFASFDQFAQVMHRMLEFYSRLAAEEGAGGRPFDIADIKTYIDQHYFEDIKISMFTEKYFLSREYLMKLFKQQFGHGIHEYVQKVRMNKAKELLNDPGLRIQEISDMLGYKDKNYFSKAFRNYYQLSPSEYRASLQTQ